MVSFIPDARKYRKDLIRDFSKALSPCLPRCDHYVPVVIVMGASAINQMPENLVNMLYCTLLHVDVCSTIIEPSILARIMDNQVWFKAHL